MDFAFLVLLCPFFRGAESMVMKFHGKVRAEVRMNFLPFRLFKDSLSQILFVKSFPENVDSFPGVRNAFEHLLSFSLSLSISL